MVVLTAYWLYGCESDMHLNDCVYLRLSTGELIDEVKSIPNVGETCGGLSLNLL